MSTLTDFGTTFVKERFENLFHDLRCDTVTEVSLLVEKNASAEVKHFLSCRVPFAS